MHAKPGPVRALTTALTIAVASIIMMTPPANAAPANVQMPFPCGETWYASTYSGHAPSEYSIDWNLTSEDTGRSVRAGVTGIATVMPFHGSYGNWVEVDAGDGWTYRYAHLSAITVANGPVTRLSEIGKVGSTGNSTGSHLHYEQRLNGIVQPATFNGIAISYTYGWPGNAYTSNNCSTPAPTRDFTGDGRGDVAWYAGSGIDILDGASNFTTVIAAFRV